MHAKAGFRLYEMCQLRLLVLGLVFLLLLLLLP
jgi:hypothetical protein